MKLSPVIFTVLAAVSPISTVLAADLPLVDSDKLRRNILRSELIAKAIALESFADNTPQQNRQIGTSGHNTTVNWLKNTLEQYGNYYQTYFQPYSMLLHVAANLTVNEKSLEVYALGMSPSGEAKGPLVHIPNLGCEKSDFPADLTGKIVLISRGTCQSAVKVGYAGAANASGAIIFNVNNPLYSSMNGYSLQKTSTPEGPYIPTGGITKTDGLDLVAQLASGASIIADLSTKTANKTTYNVIAQTTGGDQDNVLLLGAHTDSVAAGPGINDNGSGTNSLLEIAMQLPKYSVKNAVRFGWWTAEESGLLGSTFYVANLNQSEINKIRLVLTFNETGPPGSAEAEAAFQNYFTNIAHFNYTEIEFDGRSDYGPFLDVGIPCGGIDTGAEGIKTVEEQAMFGGKAGVAYDINYHRKGDSLTNLHLGAWTEMTKALAHVTALYARSWESLPPRNVSLEAKRMAMKKRRSDGSFGKGKIRQHV
ncbi:putative leucine aminopeptidase 2 [Rhexocercosporidium sp. MPI-PUGE-AT-0058]|nr:putative leucine aminopeptidase 2 [Rhexocercosporidium sp. MPI-PUGE-AT-0058]